MSEGRPNEFNPEYVSPREDIGSNSKNSPTTDRIRAILGANGPASIPTSNEDAPAEKVVDDKTTTPDQALIKIADLRRALGPTKKLDY